MRRAGHEPDLFGAAAAAASGVMRPLACDAALAVLFWGKPAEIELIHHQGMPDELCLSLSSTGGRYLAEAVRVAGVPLRVATDELPPEADRLRSALTAGGIMAVAVFPLFGERRTVGCLVIPVPFALDVSSLDDSAWVTACRALMALQVAAGASALRSLFGDQASAGVMRFDGLLVADPWERVLFADGLVLDGAGWEDAYPFGRSLDQLPGGTLLWDVRPSTPDALRWEPHLFPPSEDGGIPVEVAALETALVPGRPGDTRIILVRDLRPAGAGQRDTLDRMLALGLRLSFAADELLAPLAGLAREVEDGGLIAAFLRAAQTVPQLVRGLVEKVAPEGRLGEVSLNEALNGLVRRIARELEMERIRLFSFLDPELPVIPGDALAVVRGLRVILSNAREALRPGGGTLTVRTWQEEGWVCAAISNDGASAAPMSRFESGFEPLFGEAPDVAGEEVAKVRRSVEAMGGRMQLESRPHLWNRCTIMLPRPAVPARRDALPRGDAKVRRDGEQLEVLVVDDNAALRSVLKRFLERRGHVVTEAVDGEHALGIVAAQGFDRLIVDIQMPGKSGPEFFDSLGSVAPEMRPRTFFMTGGILEQGTEEFIDASGRPAISKPFDLAQLARTLEAEL